MGDLPVRAVNDLAQRWAASCDPHESTVFSAASVWPLLALLADAASGPARAELTAAIGEAGHPRVLALELMSFLDRIDDVRSALGVWAREGLPLTEAWSGAAVLRDQESLDEWARQRTGGLIERMPITIGRDTLLVLAAALTVRTVWRQPFEHAFRDLLFRAGTDFDSVCVIESPSGPLTRVCVEGTGSVDVHLVMGGEDVVVQGIGSFSGAMHATPGSVLFATGGSGPGVSVEEVMSFDTEAELHLYTPEFTIRAGHDLLERAVLFGLSSATDARRGHFPGISPKPLSISAARQDAMAVFGAEGFEAAAATAVGMRAGGRPPRTKRVLMVEVKPPFGFLAVHRPSGLVLTAGRIASPG